MPIGEIDNVLMRQVGEQVYFFGTVQSDKIKGITFVPVVEASKKTYVTERYEGGYQRPGSRSRMRLFMKYLKEHPNAVVPPVLLSGRDWEFQPSASNPMVGKLVVHNPAAIIDGQHRIGGYVALLEDSNILRPMDFIVLVGLTVQAEQDEFVTVNNTQKGVPKALTAFLEGEEEARLAWALNEEDDSPFKGRITRASMERRHLFALHSVARQIKRAFAHGKLVDLDEDTKLEFLIRYWTIIADELDEAWSDIRKLDDPEAAGRSDFEFKLLELTGFIAWSLMAPEILGRSFVDGVGMNWDNVRRLVALCGSVDWQKTGQYAGRTGEAGASVMRQDMERLLPADQVAQN